MEERGVVKGLDDVLGYYECVGPAGGVHAGASERHCEEVTGRHRKA